MRNIKNKIWIGMFFLMSMFMVQTVNAQVNLEVNKKAFKISDAGFRDAWKAVKCGDSKFKAMTESGFRQALTHYAEAVKFNDVNAELNYKIGVSYLVDNQLENAVKYLEKAVDTNPKVAVDAQYILGKAYHSNYQFDDAIQVFNQFINSYEETGDEQYDANLLAKAKRHIEQVNSAKGFIANPIHVTIENLGTSINSEYDDYAPVVNLDDSELMFTSRRAGTTGGARAKSDYKYYEDIYTTRRNDQGEWGSVRNMSELNSVGHNAVIKLSKDEKTLYTYNGISNTYNGTPEGTILTSNFEDGKWTKPKKLSDQINARSHETSAAVSADGNYMYFVSDREVDDFGTPSFGGKDIYVCEKNEDDKWGEVKNLGNTVNTAYNEEAIFLTPNGKTMYFSSEGFNSMGDYDIFKTELDSEGNWTEPENLAYPINTPGRDVFFITDDSQNYAYYSSVREDGLGGLDIYRISFVDDEAGDAELLTDKDELIYDEDEAADEEVVEDVHEVSFVELKGKVTDKATNEPISADVKVYDTSGNKLIAQGKTDASNGEYSLSIPTGKNYGLFVESDGYVYHSDKIAVPTNIETSKITRDVVVSKVNLGAGIELKNILFDFDKATLRSESYVELKQLKKLLNSDEKIRVVIKGHTDNIGTLEYNTKLSEARTKVVVNYLVKAGIDASRISAQGYAHLKPIDTNDTAAGRQNNRRVEFEILN